MHDKNTEDIGADNEPTDELPVLSEDAIVEAGAALEDQEAGSDSTDEHLMPFSAQARNGLAGAAAATVEPVHPQRGQAIRSLERDVAELASRWNSVEALLKANGTAIEQLKNELTAARRELGDSRGSEKQLLEELAARDTQLSQLQEDLATERRRSTDLQAAVEQADRRYAALQARFAEAEQSLAALEKGQASSTDTEQEIHPYREQIQSLTGYIAGRNDRWKEMEALADEQSARIAELENELDQRIVRQQEIEQLAHDESARADAFKAKLAETTARVADLEKRPGAAQPRPVTPEPEVEAAPEAESESGAESEPGVRPHDATVVLDETHAVRDARGERLRLAEAEREMLRERLIAAENELEHTRADLSRLEKTLVERNRSLTAQDDRIAALQQELADRLRSLSIYQEHEPKVRHIGKPGDRRERAPAAGRPGPVSPVLLCLTSDQPRQYAISKPEMTIGRATQCDIQILTQFVSREHARLLRENGGIVIEDLGSKNGVFVNSAKIDRRKLEHGDWVTVGETQFRFLAEGAA